VDPQHKKDGHPYHLCLEKVGMTTEYTSDDNASALVGFAFGGKRVF
jgi:hypothetical protein